VPSSLSRQVEQGDPKAGLVVVNSNGVAMKLCHGGRRNAGVVVRQIMMGTAMTDAGLKNETQRADHIADLATVK
jgi:hypothetical protein